MARANLALYRKYRSATFAEVIGQEHVTGPLSIALAAGRINHAYLFSGPRGCGKTSSARILARSLNCVEGPTPTPCGVCDSCRELAPNGPGSIDVIEIDAASHNGVDDARDLRERAYYSSVRDRYKVYIIDEAHMVTTNAFNALLKLIEEPPESVVFVFATTEPDKVLQTIRSRTHHYPFRLVPPAILRAHLEHICALEGAVVEPAVYPLLVRAGAGSVRDSLSLLDQLIAGSGPGGVTYAHAVALLGVTDAALIDAMVDALAVGDAASVYGTVDRVVEAGHEPRRFAADLLDRLRDLLILDAVPEAGDNGLLDVPADALARMRGQADRIGGGTAARFAEIVHSALIEMRGTTAPRLLLELVCARMLLPDAGGDAGALVQRLERLERRQQMAVESEMRAGGAGASAPPPRPARSGMAPADALGPADVLVPEVLVPEVLVPEALVPEAPVPGPPTTEPPAAGIDAPAPSASSPAPAPAPAPASALALPAALDVTAVRAIWPEVLEEVKRASRRTRALLDSAQVARIDGTHVQLVMATAPLVRMLGEASNADVVTTALAQLLPGTWTLQVGVEGTPAPPSVGGPGPGPGPGTTERPGPADGPGPAGADPPGPASWPAVAPTGAATGTGGYESPPAAASAKTAPAKAPSADRTAPARVPSAVRTAAGRVPSAKARSGDAAASRPVTESPTRSAARAGVTDDVPDELEPDEFDDDPDAPPSARHDPEAEALALLRDGLGARPVDR